jgi:hypothetical protein
MNIIQIQLKWAALGFRRKDREPGSLHLRVRLLSSFSCRPPRAQGRQRATLHCVELSIPAFQRPPSTSTDRADRGEAGEERETAVMRHKAANRTRSSIHHISNWSFRMF